MAEAQGPRVILFTGKGGVGKTTLAAGTALLAARSGSRTLVMSTDPAHSVADALDLTVDRGRPVGVAENLWVHHIDTTGQLGSAWSQIQRYLGTVLDSAGVDPLQAEEMVSLPGIEEVLALLDVRRQVASARFDTVILDCAPTAETLRLLALPDALGWYMRRVWPTERRVVSILRAPLQRATGVPMPNSSVFDAVERLHRELADVQQMLVSDRASVRLVTTPERVVMAESRRTLTTLALYGYRVDALIANRVLPAGEEGWTTAWNTAQAKNLDQLRRDAAPVPVLSADFADAEPVGAAALLELADAAYGAMDPLDSAVVPALFDVVADGADFLLHLSLPLASKDEIDVAERAGELIVTVDAHRRVVALPGVLRRCSIESAKLSDGRLTIRFVRDHEQWPAQPGELRPGEFTLGRNQEVGHV